MDDIQVFKKVIRNLQEDIENYPFQYGNEHPVVPELYARLKDSLTSPRVNIQYKQEHSANGKWRNRRIKKLSSDKSILRVRPEISFFHEGEKWRGKKKNYDLGIIASDSTVIMQGKRQGVGNFIDTRTEISILCEIKHSLNMSGQFWNAGKTDIEALAEYPGKVRNRVFAFVDWWPEDGHEKSTFQSDMENLEEKISQLSEQVEIVYLPRKGEVQYKKIGKGK